MRKSKNNVKGCWLDETLLNLNGIELTETPKNADFIYSISTVDYQNMIHKTIYFCREPPLNNSILWCYQNIDKFYLAISYYLKEGLSNQVLHNNSDFPNWVSVPKNLQKITRKNTKLRTRGIFFAGTTKERLRQNLPDGIVTISHHRKLLGEFFLNNFKDSLIVGIGWNGQTEKCKNWDIDKFSQIENSNADFVLALENTIMPNYLTEKIWHGFFSDRVTLYLGDPNIDNYIPNNCYIDLRPFYDKKSDNFDLTGLRERIESISQEEYDYILNNARNIRSTFTLKRDFWRKKTTLNVIEKIKSPFYKIVV